jgi:hypothetical protein
MTLEVKGFKPRAARNRAKRKTHRGAGEREFFQAVGDMA